MSRAVEAGPSDPAGAVAAAVIVREGRVLLIRRRRPEGDLIWALPSGQVEVGETAQEAAERETKEETGLDVRAIKNLGERVHPTTGRRMIYLACQPGLGEPSIRDVEEIADLTWAAPDELAALIPGGFYAGVRTYLGAALG
jgi:8-oxo-dGTP diphosphatase